MNWRLKIIQDIYDKGTTDEKIRIEALLGKVVEKMSKAEDLRADPRIKNPKKRAKASGLKLVKR